MIGGCVRLVSEAPVASGDVLFDSADASPGEGTGGDSTPAERPSPPPDVGVDVDPGCASSCTGCCRGTTCVPFASQSAEECGPAGAACASCSDGRDCTVDSCAQGACKNVLAAGSCLLDGACFAAGSYSATDPCALCDPTASSAGWTIQLPCVRTLAGTGVPGFKDGLLEQAQFSAPTDVVVASSLKIYIADSANHRIRKIKGTAAQAFCGSGIPGFADGAWDTAQLDLPSSVAVMPTGGVYIADTNNHRIRSSISGVVDTVAGTGAAGHTDGPAASATFNAPTGIVADGDVLYVADSNNHAIRKVTTGSAGAVTTYAGDGTQGLADGDAQTARFNLPVALALRAEKLYVADMGNSRVRWVGGGVVDTAAGTGPGYLDGPRLSARFLNPEGIAADAATIYVADTGNHRIRVITGDQVSTLAGSGVPGYEDGPAHKAQFLEPAGVAVDAAGNVYVADKANNRIRIITPKP